MSSVTQLTRKFRSVSFDELVGQSLVVRMLKNSLYVGNIFPAYLFFGQYGCGKTSLARIFAAALNCHNLYSFRQNPKTVDLPCGSCDSCVAMREGKHPDFSEIDAASCTGVDHMRSIIDAAAYVPALGQKRIYLIDEAHMLSKASFNALLKILEEPPLSVVFMLATTDVEKVIETVRSRCFQLPLQPISQETVELHLQKICKQEAITYQDQALRLIAVHARGAMRDALNLVERVRSAYQTVTVEAVQEVVGYVSDQFLESIWTCVYTKNHTELAQHLKSSIFLSVQPQLFWGRTVSFLRAVWYDYLAIVTDDGIEKTVVKKASELYGQPFVVQAIRLFYDRESAFLKSQSQRFFIEYLLLSLCQRAGIDSQQKTAIFASTSDTEKHKKTVETKVESKQKQTHAALPSEQQGSVRVEKVEQKIELKVAQEDKGVNFLKRVQAQALPMLASFFSQAECVISLNEQQVVHVQINFPSNLHALNDVLTGQAAQWVPIFKDVFGATAVYTLTFHGVNVSIVNAKPTIKTNEQAHMVSVEKKTQTQPYKKNTESFTTVAKNSFDVSDVAKWPHTNMILNYFPGTVVSVDL
ncbi:DNA polymerase III subunit gamma/tau [bacterium]|nr:MAG: DNA polymerase III subunit gamma/tau [bacterium]QQR61691.1 MAG: DNA polymerase III subunit gamma/tau [bacterium]QQR62742.1 MAG: DNA polymerase III subunit gamma/tau [bacterium]